MTHVISCYIMLYHVISCKKTTLKQLEATQLSMLYGSAGTEYGAEIDAALRLCGAVAPGYVLECSGWGNWRCKVCEWSDSIISGWWSQT